MTMLKPLALIILCTLVITHCNANEIEQTCKQTPNYNLCVQYLKADPRSSSANVTGLALIMVDVLKDKADSASERVEFLLAWLPEPLADIMYKCFGKYKTIMEVDLPKAIAALKQGDPKLAEHSVNDVLVEATTCEKGFNGKSPITENTNVVCDAATITAAIVKQLL